VTTTPLPTWGDAAELIDILDVRPDGERRYTSVVRLAGALVPSTTTTCCPYKGTAAHWSAQVGGAEVADVAWSYQEPYSKSLSIAGLLSFDEGRATVEVELPPPVELHP